MVVVEIGKANTIDAAHKCATLITRCMVVSLSSFSTYTVTNVIIWYVVWEQLTTNTYPSSLRPANVTCPFRRHVLISMKIVHWTLLFTTCFRLETSFLCSVSVLTKTLICSYARASTLRFTRMTTLTLAVTAVVCTDCWAMRCASYVSVRRVIALQCQRVIIMS